MMLTRTPPKTDKQIQLDVLADIARDFRFKPAEIGVEVDAGVVTLTGTVSNYPKLGLAAEIAGKVPGVKDVANDLTVVVAPDATRDDTWIAQAVRRALEWDVSVPDARIDSVVRRGVVTLKGTVDFWYERQAAADTVRNLIGVVSVNNHIVLAPPMRSDAAITQEISEALSRQFPMSELNVSVDRHVARLSGPVHNVQTRREAERIAWSTPGVTNVINKIEVMF
jgi:osmotically-inducible protein OsmY